MATYLQGLTDLPPIAQPHQPDFGLIQKVMGTMQGRYDQGFASVNSAHNAVLNAPITNSKLRLRKDAYVKASEEALGNLSSIDLGDEAAQQKAESVFEPFWSDDNLLFDMSYTKSTQSEIQKGLAMRDSNDEKVREQYSDVAMRHLQDGMDALAEADPDTDDFSKLERPRLVPFKNLESHLTAQAKLAGFEIKWSSDQGGGPYLVEVSNGQRSLKSFKTFAHNTLGNNFQEQFRVMGSVETNQRIKDIRANNPGITKAQAKGLIADDVLGEYKTNIDNKIADAKKQITELADKTKKYEEMTTPLSPAQEQNYKTLLLEHGELSTTGLSSLEEEAAKLSQDYAKNRDRILSNPATYFAGVMKNRTIDGWATAAAANTQTKITSNPAWVEEQRNRREENRLKFDYFKEQNRLNEEAISNKNKSKRSGTGSNSSDNSNSSDDETLEPGDIPNSDGRFISRDDVDVTKGPSAYKNFVDRQANRLAGAYGVLFNANSVGGVLTKYGVDFADAQRFLTLSNNLMRNPEGHGGTDADTELMKRVAGIINKETGISVLGPKGIGDGLSALATKYLETKGKDNGLDQTTDDVLMSIDLQRSQQQLDEYNSLEDARKKKLDDVLVSDKAFEKLTYTNTDGKKAVIDKNYIAKTFLYNPEGYPLLSDYKIHVTGEQVAEAYLNNDLTTEGGAYYMTVNGKREALHPMNMEKEGNVYNGLNALGEKHGRSDLLVKTFKKLSEEVVPNIGEYADQTGKMGSVFGFGITAKKIDEDGVRLLNEIAQPNNRNNIYIDGKVSDDTDTNKAIVQMLSQGDGAMHDYISEAYLHTNGPNGNPRIKVTFKPVKTTEKTEIGGVALKDLAAKEVFVELNPNSTGPTIHKFRSSTGMYIYDSLLKGKPFKSTNAQAASNFNLSIVPDGLGSGDVQGATILINRKIYKDGTWIEDPAGPAKKYFRFNEKNPDELVKMTQDLYIQHLQQNKAAQQQYKTTNKTTLKTAQQIKEEMKQNQLVR